MEDFLTERNLNKGYQYFNGKHYNTKFTPTESSKKIGEKFILLCDKKLKGTLKVGFLYKYLLFQFSYWNSCTIEQYNKRVNYSFIYGEKAFKRYLERNISMDFLLHSVDFLYLQQLKISEREFKQLFKTKLVRQTKRVPYNNPIRKIRLNTDLGLFTCSSNYLFFTELDESCKVCIFKEDCLTLKKENNL